jgi:hypothetical protein
MRPTPWQTGAAAVVLGLVLPVLTPGCGPAAPEVDPAAQYTPESLAQELVFRYRALQPEARKSTRRLSLGSKSAKRTADLERARQAEKKGGDPAATKKRTGPATLDDVLEDVDAKIDRIRATPRAATCRQMIEVISKDDSLTADDRKLLAEKLEELGRAS